MNVRTKVVVISITETAGWNGKQKPINKQIKMSIVNDGASAENIMFAQISGGTAIDLQTINPVAADQFKIGQEFYVDFIPVE